MEKVKLVLLLVLLVMISSCSELKDDLRVICVASDEVFNDHTIPESEKYF